MNQPASGAVSTKQASGKITDDKSRRSEVSIPTGSISMNFDWHLFIVHNVYMGIPAENLRARKTRRMLLLLQAGFALLALACAVLVWRVNTMLPPELSIIEFPGSDYAKPVLLAVVVLLFPLLRRLQRYFHRRAKEADGTVLKAEDLLAGGYVILFGLSELPALFGLILSLMGNPLNILLLTTGISLFYLACMTPTARLFLTVAE